MTSVEVEVDKFKEAFAKFQSTSKRTIAQNLQKQAGLFVQELAILTPPGDYKSKSWRKKAGEQAVKSDILKVIKPAKRISKKLQSQSDLASALLDATGFANPALVHKQYRRKRGRVQTRLKKGGRDERFKVQPEILKAYILSVQQRVGYMAAGWLKAAQFLGKSLPSWITRHSAPGNGTVNIGDEDVEVVLTNAAVYPESRGLMDRRIETALKRRYWAMVKQADNYMKMVAQKAGL